MTARTLAGAGYKVLGIGKLTIASPATTALDFGTPDDLKLVVGTNSFKGTDRVLLVCTASTAGTTSTLTWVVQDADDNAGNIGTPATAITDGTLAGGTGDDARVVGVVLQKDRPWLRVSVTHATATDSFVCHCVALGATSGG